MLSLIAILLLVGIHIMHIQITKPLFTLPKSHLLSYTSIPYWLFHHEMQSTVKYMYADPSNIAWCFTD